MVELEDTIGHETTGGHPAITLALHGSTQLASVVPLTSTSGASRFPYTFLIRRSATNRLRVDSIALIFQLRSLSYERFISRFGSIDQQDYDMILTIVKDYLNIPS